MIKRRRNRLLAVVLLSLGIVSATYGLTAANTVPTSKAGDGANTISGYTVSGVHYTPNSSDPTLLDKVQFSLNSTPVAGSTIRAKVVSSGSTWYDCTWAGTAVECPTTAPQATVVSVNELRVVVAD